MNRQQHQTQKSLLESRRHNPQSGRRILQLDRRDAEGHQKQFLCSRPPAQTPSPVASFTGIHTPMGSQSTHGKAYQMKPRSEWLLDASLQGDHFPCPDCNPDGEVRNVWLLRLRPLQPRRLHLPLYWYRVGAARRLETGTCRFHSVGSHLSVHRGASDLPHPVGPVVARLW